MKKQAKKKATGSRLQATGSRLQATGSRLQATGSRLQATGSRLQAQGETGKRKRRRRPAPEACSPKSEARGLKEWERISPALMPLGIPIGQLHAAPDNARRHPDRNIEAIMASLAKFGQQAPAVYVLRAGKKIVIKGNGLLAAAKSLGWTRLAAVRSGLAEQDAKAYAIADNRTTDLSEFDEELLAAQLAELDEADYDLASIGYTDAERHNLLKDATGEDGDDGGEDGGEGVKAKRAHGVSNMYSVIVECKDERDQLRFYERMKKEGRKCKLYML
jgi:hypothetical protein